MKLRKDILWILAGLLASLAIVWAFPRAYPLFPLDWTISKQEAEVIALERMRDLGEIPLAPYIVTTLEGALLREVRLQRALPTVGAARLRESRAGQDLLSWQVRVYDRSASSGDWSFSADVGVHGELTELLLRVPADQPRGELGQAQARGRANRVLEQQGLDLSRFDEPEILSRQLQARTDLLVRYQESDRMLGGGITTGVVVSFAGDQLAGFELFFEDPERAEVQASVRPLAVLQQTRIWMTVLLLAGVAVPFVRRYHAGEIGVHRGLQIGGLVLVSAIVLLIFGIRAAGAEWSFGLLTQPQVTWLVAGQLLVFYFFPMALVAFLSWSVGESLCREEKPSSLASFDAFLKLDWLNSTFARESLRGVVGGLVTIAVIWSAIALGRPQGIWATTAEHFGPWWQNTAWFSLPLLGSAVAHSLYQGLFARLLLTSWAVGKLGVWFGGMVSVAASMLLFFPLVQVFPSSLSPVFWAVAPTIFVVMFLRYGLWASILASLTATVVAAAAPLLTVDDPAVQFQASLALLVVAAPVIASLRYLSSPREVVYRFEDVPPHVRRIADRERQKVELETARRIQTSILPDLPAEINGIQMAYAYQPAAEVGGDFYDVLALEDGRVALAVGDVAGHGVSSGLVMSMAKSALAVQVTFDPEVKAVFRTLNRMVFQSARRRLLTTLCYAVVDPKRREMVFASAGHLFPYRIATGGDVQPLESVSYPLGAREELEVRVRTARLEAGDCLFLFSDGVVESLERDGEDAFGFERLELSLRRHSGGSVGDLKRGVLEDLAEFSGAGPRQDDLTLVVLQIP